MVEIEIYLQFVILPLWSGWQTSKLKSYIFWRGAFV